MNIDEIITQIKPADKNAIEKARETQNNFIKPVGSLGELENISIKFAGITGKIFNHVQRKIIFLFGADHEIYNEGVATAPQIFTRELMKIYASTQNAGINILAKQAGAELKLFDLGIKDFKNFDNVDFSLKYLENGTANFLTQEAMTLNIAQKYIQAGFNLIEQYKNQGFNLFGMGEVGMSNTTPATACIMAAAENFNPDLIGRGAGLSDEALNLKRNVILKALNFHQDNISKSPVHIISCVGGAEIAAMTGLFLGAGFFRVPVIVDGITSIAAALITYKLYPDIRDYIFLSNKSPEPAYEIAAEILNLNAPLNLKMRLGEGTACAMMMPVIESALEIMNNMRSFKNDGNL